MSSLGKQLMDFIDKGVICIPVNENGKMLPGWRWRNEAEPGLTAFMDEILTKAVREEMCRQLSAVVKNIQELVDP